MKYCIRKTIMASAAAAALLAIVGCETTAPAPAVPRIAPDFDYTPVEVATGDVDITLAVVGSSVETTVPVFKDFAKNMAQDFLELLSAIGYRTRGPYVSYDEMTFPDKEASDLILSADYDFDHDTLSLTATEAPTLASAIRDLGVILGTRSSASSSTPRNCTYSGPITVASRVTLVLYESLSRERMWTKSLNLEPIEATLEGTYAFPCEAPPSLAQILVEEDQFYTDLGKQMEAQYQDALRTTHAHLDPREVARISKQADPLRERKRY
ncbi:MAG: hypothetical protein OXF31_06330 [Gammaproteobacteria bacterium]|nr:hypothetical protein [Gammaproteobacteria bacterium]